MSKSAPISEDEYRKLIFRTGYQTVPYVFPEITPGELNTNHDLKNHIRRDASRLPFTNARLLDIFLEEYAWTRNSLRSTGGFPKWIPTDELLPGDCQIDDGVANHFQENLRVWIRDSFRNAVDGPQLYAAGMHRFVILSNLFGVIAPSYSMHWPRSPLFYAGNDNDLSNL